MAVFPLVNCGKGADSGPQSVSVQELSKLIDSGQELFLLDVRTKPEYEEAHLGATDDRIPYDRLESNMDRLPADKSAAIYCYCRVGHRSGIAADFLLSRGYENVFNVEGGIIAWQNEGFKVVSVR